MATRQSTAEWKGTLKAGSGTLSTQSATLKDTPYSFKARFGDGKGTNPEELIGAAHAGCYSMFLSALLGDAGFTPTSIRTSATVHLDEAAFRGHAEKAKEGCPVSKALAGPKITLDAQLL